MIINTIITRKLEQDSCDISEMNANINDISDEHVERHTFGLLRIYDKKLDEMNAKNEEYCVSDYCRHPGH